MTILKCDACGKEVEEFKAQSTSNFPEGYQEVGECCWQKVVDAIHKADEAAKEASDKIFAKTFQVAVNAPSLLK